MPRGREMGSSDMFPIAPETDISSSLSRSLLDRRGFFHLYREANGVSSYVPTPRPSDAPDTVTPLAFETATGKQRETDNLSVEEELVLLRAEQHNLQVRLILGLTVSALERAGWNNSPGRRRSGSCFVKCYYFQTTLARGSAYGILTGLSGI